MTLLQTGDPQLSRHHVSGRPPVPEEVASPLAEEGGRPSAHVSVFMAAPCPFECGSFTACFEIRKRAYSNFVLSSQHRFYSLGSLEISYEFQDDFFLVLQKNATRILVRTLLHKSTPPNRIGILTILSLREFVSF